MINDRSNININFAILFYILEALRKLTKIKSQFFKALRAVYTHTLHKTFSLQFMNLQHSIVT